MKSILRSPFFWITFSLLSVLLTIFTFKYFSQAFPIVHLNITMDRAGSITKAQELAQQFHVGPDSPQNAVSFDTDTFVKTFVELEGGGKQAFVDMMQEHLYEPYTWHVRLFKAYEPNEVHMRFTPDGKPYGFIETLSENTPGPQLAVDQARTIAQKGAAEWHVPLHEFTLIESAKEIQPSGRADHTFVYERPEKRIGEGYYRVQLTVSGDKFTAVTHSVKVPEGFERRYAHMRSANENIATAATIALYLLYIIGGCFIGLFFLYRERWLIWQMPFRWALLISLLGALDSFNKLPLRWMIYNTALAPEGFLLQYIVSIFSRFLYEIIYFLLIFMAAESLTRKAFRGQIQLWHLWSLPVASSLPVLGRTIAGYLLVTLDFAFVVAFYIFTTTYFKWWIPSDSLFDPNVLATYLPWLTSIARSLEAGFVEECLFRAVPLAGAALLGQRFGKKRLWLATAFIMQAVIFGAAHASYPAQPAYARLVELLFFSFFTGWIYIKFGLLPTIITHFVYDVIWFALPLFVSSAPSATINRILVLFFTLIPIWIVLRARIKMGVFKPIDRAVYNKAWLPPALAKKAREITSIIPITVSLSSLKKNCILASGVIGLIVWLLSAPFASDGLPLHIKRHAALTTAQHNLEQRNIKLPPPWYEMASVFAHYENHQATAYQHRFIWQEGGKKLYRSLLGTYLTPAHWNVRFAKFEGDIVERAEEYKVFIIKDGLVFRTLHDLPETRPGKTLSEEQARIIAHKAVQDRYNLDPSQLKKISATADKKPQRMDWQFTFADHQNYSLEKGEARIDVQIAGDKVVDSYRYIHVPEEWERAEQNKQPFVHIITQLCSLMIYGLFFIGIVLSLAHWGSGTTTGTTLWYFILLLAFFVFNLINNWPHYIALFNTSQPFYDQVFRLFGTHAIGILMRTASMALVIGFLNSFKITYKLAKQFSTYALGISLGIIAAALYAGIQQCVPSLEPHWADYTALRAWLPINAGINSTITVFIGLTLLCLLAFVTVSYVTDHGQKRHSLASMLLVLFGMILIGLRFPDNFILLLTAGLGMGIFFVIAYYIIVRFDHALIPLATGSYVILNAIQQGTFNAQPFALPIAIGSNIIIALLAWYWSRQLNQ